ncbi:hypothetical protein P3X46_001951 [Hevea brasiliensis]|uniref:Uncharacterized protein n=1 Tax=Hevea brasiliensis TaxID=3981 RepID=A0ABQ9N3R3_HEVBR|nr:hypothetical protein P3X46_001951 [Hevea brasiliensis]
MSFPKLNALRDLHNSANDLLHSPEIQQVLAHQKQEMWFINVSKDVLLFVNEHLLDLQFTLPGKIFNQPNINKLNKETLKCLGSLKGMKNKSVVTSDISTIDHKLTVVVEVLREVRVITITIVESLLSLVSIPWLDQKSTKGSFRSNFFSSGGQIMYEICDETALQSANKRLEAVEIAIEDLEAELECIFRRLIQTRVSLPNTLTN